MRVPNMGLGGRSVLLCLLAVSSSSRPHQTPSAWLHLNPSPPSTWAQGTPGVSYGCHPLVAVLGILGPQLQGLLVLMVEVNSEVVLWGRAQWLWLCPTQGWQKALSDPPRVGSSKKTTFGNTRSPATTCCPQHSHATSEENPRGNPAGQKPSFRKT